MKKALFVASIVVFSMLVPELFSGSDLLADPAGCCMQRPNINVPFIRNNLTFAACQQLNLALDNDNIFQETGRVYWDLRGLQCQ